MARRRVPHYLEARSDRLGRVEWRGVHKAFSNYKKKRIYDIYDHNVYVHMIYKVSVKKGRSHGGSMEEVKENKKVL